MSGNQRLYLFTLEIDPLAANGMYNPLPAHLTLVSRFRSPASPEKISECVAPCFSRARGIELMFGDLAVLGPKGVNADMVVPSTELRTLHEQLVEALTAVGAEYENPQYISNGWRPHVSKRQETTFKPGDKHLTTAAYLIEVEVRGEKHIRLIRNRFILSR